MARDRSSRPEEASVAPTTGPQRPFLVATTGSGARRSRSPAEGGDRREATRRQIERDARVVLPPDELDVVTLPAFTARLLDQEPDADLVIDMSSVTYCGAAGIAALAAVRDRLQAGGGTLTLHRPTATMRRVLEVCGELDAFDIAFEAGTPRRHSPAARSSSR